MGSGGNRITRKSAERLEEKRKDTGGGGRRGWGHKGFRVKEKEEDKGKGKEEDDGT